ncbi:MAG TPA: hypothetical protein VFF50_03255 [Candidatus Deferrimicrobiaceae bacterium]|nr:hypothetical protein [Candidatus Deferrimicrobiaceae bacterium]
MAEVEFVILSGTNEFVCNITRGGSDIFKSATSEGGQPVVKFFLLLRSSLLLIGILVLTWAIDAQVPARKAASQTPIKIDAASAVFIPGQK